MTLVLALCAQDGVVMASDGQATTEDPVAPTRAKAEPKLHSLHGRVAYGCAGSAGLIQRVVAALETSVSADDCALPLSELRPKLHAVVNAEQRAAFAEHVPIGRADPAHVEMLFAGVRDGKPWIYEITVNGADELHSNGQAIGHATHFPMYLMVSTLHYRMQERGVEQVKVLAYRAVADAIRTDASRLGNPIHLVVVTEQGADKLDGDRIGAVDGTLNSWKGQESDIFRALPGEPAEEGRPQPPEPRPGIGVDDGG